MATLSLDQLTVTVTYLERHNRIFVPDAKNEELHTFTKREGSAGRT